MLLGLGTALWLGILTSISPCPLATNIAAISFIGKQVGDTRQVILSGLIYTLGRMVAYLLVGIIVVAGILSIPGMSNFLQEYMNKILGPLLIIVGVILLGLIKVIWSNVAGSAWVQSKAEGNGLWGAGLLGIAFALSFCPVSAALFFGSLIPLAVGVGSTIAYPLVFGIGTGLPVIVFAILLAYGTKTVGKAYNRLKQIEYWMRRITGAIFIIVGIYYILTYTIGIVF